METNRYGALASRAYELDKPVGHSFGDVEFYLALLRGVPGPILEPAVGTGRVLIPLLRAGLDVDGFDASPEMLAICRRTCEAAGVAPRLSQASFEDFSSEREYAAIILPAGSFQLITSFESALAVLKRFHAHLATAGRLLIDLSVASAIYRAAPRARHWHDPAGDLLTLHETPAALDDVAQIATFHLRYDLWRHGTLISSELDIFTLRWWGLDEFRLALEHIGFTKVRIYGDYDPTAPPTSGHQTLTFEASR